MTLAVIAALWRKDGVAAQRSELEMMLDAMPLAQRRGRRLQVANGFALGCDSVTPTTSEPEGLGHLVHVIDGELFGKRGLGRGGESTFFAQLAAPDRSAPNLSQSLAEFTMIAVDTEASQIIAVRDPVGTRPLYYHDSADMLLIASHPAAIIALKPAVASQVDEAALHAYAAGEAHAIDRTALANVRRLPPGHRLIASRAGVVVERFLSRNIKPRRRGADHPSRFAELLSAAIRDRLLVGTPTAAMLSGGLDSSSIVALASRLPEIVPPLRTYSQVFPEDPDGDERQFIATIVAECAAEPTFLAVDPIGPFDDLDGLLSSQAGPFIAPNLATMIYMLKRVRADGLTTILDGHGGDEVVSYGIEHLYDLAWRGNWIRLWRRLGPFARAERQSRRRLFAASLWAYGPHRRRLKQPAPSPAPPWVRRSLPATPLESLRPGHLGPDAHLAQLTSAFFVQGLETLRHAAMSAGVDIRMPFLDERMITWCVSADGAEKLADGYTRALLRRGMAGLLPDRVRLRRDKHRFGGHLARGMLRAQSSVETALSDHQGSLANYFVLSELERIWASLRSDWRGVSGSEIQALWRAVILCRWLELRSPAGMQ